MGSDHLSEDVGLDDELDDRDEPILRRAPRIKEVEVYRVADQLLIEGHRPSVERIRSTLGRGSPNTIALFLDRWWSQLGARLRDLPGQELPTIPTDVAATMHTLWTQSIDHARNVLHDTLAQQSTELTERRDALQLRAAELMHERAEVQREREVLHRHATLAQSQLEVANERHRTDTIRIQELENEKLRSQVLLDETRSDRDAVIKRLEAAQQQHQDDVRALNERMEATERHWLKELDEARVALTNERKALHAIERQLTTERVNLNQQLQEEKERSTALNAQLVRTKDQLATVQQQAAKLDKSLDEQTQRGDRAVQLLAETQAQGARQIDTLQRQLQQQNEQITQLTGKLIGNKRTSSPPKQ